jgi:hypothetical protein
MASAAQISANRANAQLSTGPPSVEGKAASSRNSLKLGIYSESLIIPGEDPEALAELTRSYEEHYQPVGPVEVGLLQTIIRSQWLKQRYARIETEVINARVAALPPDTKNPLGAAFIEDSAHGNTLAKLARRQNSLERDWYKAIETRSRLQSERKQAEAYAARHTAIASKPAASRAKRVRFDNLDETFAEAMADMDHVMAELDYVEREAGLRTPESPDDAY